jgi:hypothetical protein
MLCLSKSPSDSVHPPKNDKIHVIYQFFVHPDKSRQAEVEYCLEKNVNNPLIERVHLLNEKIYGVKQLGVKSDKITQVNIGKRLTYKDVFDYVDEFKIDGYIVFCNSDIFFDNSLKNLTTSSLGYERSCYSLLRFEFNNETNLKKCKIFGPRGDSQDTWIFHSNYNILPKQREVFNFYFGKPGCDNKLIYLFHLLGYTVYNEPYVVKTYHYHSTNIRNYNASEVLHSPMSNIFPQLTNDDVMLNIKEQMFKLKTKDFTKYDLYQDNKKLYKYLSEKIKNNQPFVIPRIAGVENNVVFIAKNVKPEQYANSPQFTGMAYTMKNNAGINLPTTASAEAYASSYLEPFKQCDLFFDWEEYGNVYPVIKNSHDWILRTHNDKQTLWAFTLDVFNYINSNPWTLALKGQRILIISSFADTIEKQIQHREKIYGIDLFPDCSFVFIKPPQTQGQNESRDWILECLEFMNKINHMKDQFDIALCSCGGYGNPVVGFIRSIGKSAIYIGGVLQMYFGVLGGRWEKERQDIIELYKNEYWARPAEEERPKGHETIERSCYW